MDGVGGKAAGSRRAGGTTGHDRRDASGNSGGWRGGVGVLCTSTRRTHSFTVRRADGCTGEDRWCRSAVGEFLCSGRKQLLRGQRSGPTEESKVTVGELQLCKVETAAFSCAETFRCDAAAGFPQ